MLIDRGARLNNALLSAEDNYTMVKLLLSHDASIITAPGGISAISNAASGGDTEIVRLLIAHANKEELESSRDALNWAASRGHMDTVKTLIEY